MWKPKVQKRGACASIFAFRLTIKLPAAFSISSGIKEAAGMEVILLQMLVIMFLRNANNTHRPTRYDHVQSSLSQGFPKCLLYRAVIGSARKSARNCNMKG